MRRCATLAAALGLAASLVGCSDTTPTAPGGGGPATAPNAQAAAVAEKAMRERRSLDLADEFADALARREWDRAYAMTSSHLRQQESPEQFRATHAKARLDFGAPMQVDVRPGPQDLREENRAADGVPEFLPKGAARGWVYADFAVDMDNEGTVFRYYRCSVLIVDDGGAEKVGWVTYAWGEPAS